MIYLQVQFSNMSNFKEILQSEKDKYKQDSNNSNHKPKDDIKLFNPLLINPLNLKNFHGKGYEKL